MAYVICTEIPADATPERAQAIRHEAMATLVGLACAKLEFGQEYVFRADMVPASKRGAGTIYNVVGGFEPAPASEGKP